MQDWHKYPKPSGPRKKRVSKATRMYTDYIKHIVEMRKLINKSCEIKRERNISLAEAVDACKEDLNKKTGENND